MLSTATVLALLAAALYVVIANWACAYLSLRNSRLGIDKHYSMVPIVPQLLVGIAWLLYDPKVTSWLPGLVFLFIAIADLSLWSLLWLPVVLIRHYRSDA
jgi:hypothetical protein